MSSLRLIADSLVHHWRMNLAVACGVAAATAVLTGALLVGDCMRGSLRSLTLGRLGRIDEVLLTDRFFRAKLAEELSAEPQFREHFSVAVPGILLRASLQNADLHAPRRANRVTLIGCDQSFWQLGAAAPVEPPEPREIVINQPLAERLDAAVGEEVLLRLPRGGTIPAESSLGQKRETVGTVRLKVSEIIPAEGLGRFGLRPSQLLPQNAYVSLDWLQGRLERPGRANAIFVAGKSATGAPTPESKSVVQQLLKPIPDDFGLIVEKTPRGYFNITSDRMLLEPAAEKAILRTLEGEEVQPALTYLANTIASGKGKASREIPYSTITGVDPTDRPPLGPFLREEPRTPPANPRPVTSIGDGEIVLNSWAAAELDAKPGDLIRVSYFEPETIHGELREETIELKLAAVVELAGAADDRHFTPAVPGITDELSMAEWDPPFSFDTRWIRQKDEVYWDAHGATPKAFVSLATGRRLWSSRFGRTTSIRLRPREALTVEGLERKLTLDPAPLRFVFQPVKRQGLAASAGATPFGVLFLCFSFFIIAAAVMLIALLFRLGIDYRARQLGTLVAVGFTRWRITRLLLGEGVCVAALGSLAGVPVGVAYAALMLLGLRTWWLAAVGTPLLRLYVEPSSLVIGFSVGLIVAVLAIVLTVWRTRRLSPRQLLSGETSDVIAEVGGRSRWARILAWMLLIAAVIFGLSATRIGEEMQAGAFFGVGAVVLVACLVLVWSCLRRGATGTAVAVGRGNLLRIAARNAARNSTRSTLCIGLVASACFLIVAISAFHLDPTGQTPSLGSGNGGFALVAQSDRPLYHNPGTPEGRAELGFTNRDSRLLAGNKLVALRVKPGDDATCLNLYQPRQPRVLGVPELLVGRGGFAWADSAASTPAQKQNPWLLLEEKLGADNDGVPLIPVILEKNTATYALHLYRGVGETYDVADGRGGTIRLKIVGLLAASIFQGELLISERAFLRCFPEVSGHRFFLVETKSERTDAVQNALEETLGDHGLTAETTGSRLAGFLAVQNTYLSTFQSLGGLGLLLGTFALAAVQLRGVLERRSELALLRAAGFRRRTLAAMVLLENGLLLVAGLACGTMAALVAVLPHLLSRAASIPWASLAATLALVLVVGLLAAATAVRAALRAPLLAALREER